MATKWKMKRDDKIYGPYSWAQLKSFAAENRIDEGDYLKNDNMAEWLPAAEIENLLGKQDRPRKRVKNQRQPKNAVSGKSFAMITASVISGIAVLAVLLFIIFSHLLPGYQDEFQMNELTLTLEIDEQDQPGDMVDTIQTNTPEVYLSADVVAPDEHTVIQTVWIWEDEDHQIGTHELALERGFSRAIFRFAQPPEGWPEGSYRVEILCNEEKIDILRFTVQ